MQNSAGVLENDTRVHLWDCDIITDHLISVRRQDLIIITKKKKRENLQNCGFCYLADHTIKLKECEKKDKYLDFAKESKNPLNRRWQMYQS